MENEKQSEKDYTEFVNLLNKHKVDYLVVGGYAVMFHTLYAGHSDARIMTPSFEISISASPFGVTKEVARNR